LRDKEGTNEKKKGTKKEKIEKECVEWNKTKSSGKY
jgi:hypothetical protein